MDDAAMTVTSTPISIDDGFFVDTDLTLVFFISDTDPLTGTSPPGPLNCTGFTVQFKLGPNEGGAAVLTLAGTVVDGPAGHITVAVADTDTAALTPGVYLYTLRRTDAGAERMLASESCVLRPTLT
jgi:hypothetical protein